MIDLNPQSVNTQISHTSQIWAEYLEDEQYREFYIILHLPHGDFPLPISISSTEYGAQTAQSLANVFDFIAQDIRSQLDG